MPKVENFKEEVQKYLIEANPSIKGAIKKQLTTNVYKPYQQDACFDFIMSIFQEWINQCTLPSEITHLSIKGVHEDLQNLIGFYLSYIELVNNNIISDEILFDEELFKMYVNSPDEISIKIYKSVKEKLISDNKKIKNKKIDEIVGYIINASNCTIFFNNFLEKYFDEYPKHEITQSRNWFNLIISDAEKISYSDNSDRQKREELIELLHRMEEGLE